MRVLKNSGKTVFVASAAGGNCPRASITNKKIKFADDFYGKVKIGKSLISKLF